jgi:sensor histidine kinase YesM
MPMSLRIPFPSRRFLIDGLYAQLINLIAALVITFIMGVGRHFFHNLVASVCIGTTAWLLIDGIRLLIWGEGKPNWPLFCVVVLIAAPIAQIIGSHLTGYLLGFDFNTSKAIASGNMTGMMLFTILAAGGATIFFMGRDKVMRAEAAAANERARAEQVERQALQAKLQLLQAQIEPHMLFNTLANLQGLIAIDPPKAQQMLDQLIQFLRATLSSSRSESNTLGEEFALMDAYLGLMSVRMGSRLAYSLDLPDDLRDQRVPPMLLQPLVENAIAHGLEPKVEGGQVSVTVRKEGTCLVLDVCDDGRGLDAGPGKEGTNLGLHNTRARLKAIYGDRASLALEPNSPCGALARVTIPMEAAA